MSRDEFLADVLDKIEMALDRGWVLEPPLGDFCAYCSCELTEERGPNQGHIEHVIPRCQGGTNEPTNLVYACRTCNLRKGGRTPEQWGHALVTSTPAGLWAQVYTEAS